MKKRGNFDLNGISAEQRKSKNSPLEDWRTLVHFLERKTETLYRNCLSDQEKQSQILSMGSTLADLTAIINRLYEDSGYVHTPDILVDAHGFTYRTVRSCDLDRICEK